MIASMAASSSTTKKRDRDSGVFKALAKSLVLMLQSTRVSRALRASYEIRADFF